MIGLLEHVRGCLESYLPELIAIRQDLHAHPELGMEERRTSAVVEGRLRDWGIEEVERIATTGVVARIAGRQPGGQIGLRADMDALAITEETGLTYASRFLGRMHACGHDGHTTMLLGAARYLAGNPDFAGTVNLVFQPAEEGRGGARAVIADGLFERFPCTAIYGLHAMPGLPLGHFATRHGAFFAAACPWRITFRGTGGHGGAAPHRANDVMVVLGSFLQSLHTIVSRNIAATDVAVMSVGYAHGGSAESPSVIPPDVVVGGTARCFSEDTAVILARRLQQLATACAQAHNCSADVEIAWRAPPLINHAREVEVAVAAAIDVAGRHAVDRDAEPLTAGEDFSEMLKIRPGAFVLLGNGEAHAEPPSGLHTPHFDFNDALIPIGIAYWVAVVNRELGNVK
ncbi:amidohydrolase [Bradyrhizobium sp. SZCCHNRI1003]|uniref:amidohydrolase n=1 Tax=Bradyrhizobium sp. SZCCHNRI1003 TaxID=3057275 RepID=UPI002916946B|nr:amidohydrolase [Bradyrhizobium sp. SZCCHNRI1003]